MALALRRLGLYRYFIGLTVKQHLAYSLWFWASLLLRLVAMAVVVYFWRGIYGNTASLNGIDLATTLNYILMAQLFNTLQDTMVLWEFGYNLREGGIIIELLRPLDLQLRYYVEALANTAAQIVESLPMAVAAVLFFGLSFPTDWQVWAAFAVAALLGRTIMYLFDWILAGLTFYVTETWGVGVLIMGLSLFASGSLVPLAMMPGWLQTVVLAMPFAQTTAVPMQLLSGISPLSEAPRLWFIQSLWVIGLFVVGRLFFNRALRRVTVQGG